MQKTVTVERWLVEETDDWHNLQPYDAKILTAAVEYCQLSIDSISPIRGIILTAALGSKPSMCVLRTHTI
jgi:hypothetical protein